MNNQWDENKHPRAPDGKFTDGHNLTPETKDIPPMEKTAGIMDGKGETERPKKTGVIKRLASYKGKPGATYNYDTGEVVHLTSGYMVSFHCNEADENGHYKSHFGRYTEEEYDNLANSFAEENDADTYIGTYDEEPEVSFHIKNLDQARKLMIKYNQDAIWDNAAGVPIMNKKRDKSKNPMRGNDEFS